MCFSCAFGSSSSSETVFSEICTLIDQINNDTKAALDAFGLRLSIEVSNVIIPRIFDDFKDPVTKLVGLAQKNVTGAYDILSEYVNEFFVFYQEIITAFDEENLSTVICNVNQKFEDLYVQMARFCEGHVDNVYQTESFKECYREYEPALIASAHKTNDSVMALINGSFQVLDENLAPVFDELTALANNFLESMDKNCGSDEECDVQYVININRKIQFLNNIF